MSPQQIEVHPEAVAEARAATEWYREKSVLVADAFLTELDRAIERIAEKPEISILKIVDCFAFVELNKGYKKKVVRGIWKIL
jgi:hypothetical protein